MAAWRLPYLARFTPTAVALLLLVPGVLVLGVATPAEAAGYLYTDVRMASFDGTEIMTTVFWPADASASSPVPFILMTHGWAGQRTATPTGRVADFLDAGYGVVTWDSRGFGVSGGEVQLNSPDFEVKDVSAILDFVVANVPQAARVGSDPVIGMSGGSYAGGIQLLAAAFDERIDVIAPEITWNDLTQSLAPNGVPKLYWTSLLFGAGQEASCLNARNNNPTGALYWGAASGGAGCQTSDLARYYAEVHATNAVSAEMDAALQYRSPKTYMSEIDVPTLLIQGFPDTLFDVNQAVANYEGIKANGAPVKLWLYDGGHGHVESALANTQAGLITPTVINWMDRHLKGDVNVDTGAEVEYYADGAWHDAAAWPDPASTPGAKHQAGIPMLTLAPITAGPPSSYTLKLADGPTLVAGPAHISFTASGTGTEGILFLALGVQTATGTIVADKQVQPARFTLGVGASTPVDVDLVSVQAAVPAGGSLVLLITTLDQFYNGNRAPGYVNVENIDVSWYSQ